jgi:hypothetical protein
MKRNIYKIGKKLFITSDEEIKVNNYITDGYLVWQWKDDSSLLGRKKIILTTDQDLIANGVQAIDDEFLTWFCKNPSCEFVEVEDWYNKFLSCCRSKEECYCNKKRIIIPSEPKMIDCGNKNCQGGVINGLNPRLCKKCNPQEKPKQETLNLDKLESQLDNALAKETKESLSNWLNSKRNNMKETLEEAAINCWAEGAWDNRDDFTDGFIEGAKWQSERIPSIIEEYNETAFISKEQGYMKPKEWFEQFKKKP